MVPANDQLYVDIEKALSQDDVREMVVPPERPADVAVATKGERKARVDERAGNRKCRRVHGARGRGRPYGPSPCGRAPARRPRVWMGSSTRSRSLGPIPMIPLGPGNGIP